MTAFIVMETQITLACSCADLLPQNHNMFSHQGKWAVRGSGSAMGPKRMGWGCWCGWCLENWWSQGALLPSQTRLCRCSISFWRLSPAMISSPNGLQHLILIVKISGLGMPWMPQSNISSFILFYQVVIGFHQTVRFSNKQIISKANSSFCFVPCHQALVCTIVWGKVEVEGEGCACSPQENAWKFRQWLTR